MLSRELMMKKRRQEVGIEEGVPMKMNRLRYLNLPL